MVEEVITHEEVLAGEERLRSGKSVLDVGCNAGFIDGDPSRSAAGLAKRKGLPFRVIDERQAARFAHQYEHIIIDTQARPTQENLHALPEGRDLLVIPVTPDALSLDALFLILDALEDIGSSRFRVLLTIVPPRPSRDGEEACTKLEDVGVPVLKTSIRRFVGFQKAAFQGVPVYEVNDPNAQEGWEEYQQVGRELLYEVTDKSAGQM